MKRKPHRREATPVAHMILSKRMADHRPHDMICELVDNALAFSDPGQEVRVTGLFEQADYLISISDRGIGMPAPFRMESPAATAGPPIQLASTGLRVLWA